MCRFGDVLREIDQIMKKGFKYIFITGAIASVFILLVILGSRFLILSAAEGKTFSHIEDLETHKVGLVLGCARYLSSGGENLYFRYRIEAAAQLYKSGKVTYLLVSGDNRTLDYDEPTQMKAALIELGVPEQDIYCDYAGLRTLDSVVRAKEIFQQSEFVIVSQEFHNQRALYLAQAFGIDAIGYNAKEVHFSSSIRTSLREQLARTKAVLDVHLLKRRPKFGGDAIVIGEL